MEKLGKNPADPQSKLVLIVDDDESICELLESIVKREGFRSIIVVDGEQALEKITKDMPNLVILDLMLPRRGGFDVLRQVQTGETARIPIVTITGRRTDRTTVEMIRQEPNVVEFMEKPIRPYVLAALLHKILGTSPPGLKRLEPGL